MSLLPPSSPKSPMARQDLYLQWIEKIEREGVNLTVWEEDFIESVSDQMQAGGLLTDNQGETLERIYTERTP